MLSISEKDGAKESVSATQKGWEHQARPYMFTRQETCHLQADDDAIPALARAGVIYTAPRMRLTPSAGERPGGCQAGGEPLWLGCCPEAL